MMGEDPLLSTVIGCHVSCKVGIMVVEDEVITEVAKSGMRFQNTSGYLFRSRGLVIIELQTRL